MAGVSIRVEGVDEAAKAVRAAADRAARPRGLWEEIGQLLVASTIDRFEREQDPDGNPWPRSIRVMLLGGKTLTDTAHLRNSVTYELLADGVAVGTNVIYAAVHQFGATISAKNADFLHFMVVGNHVQKRQVTIPARPFLGVSIADADEIGLAWEDWLGEPMGIVHAQ